MRIMRFLWIICAFLCSDVCFGQLLPSSEEKVVLKTSTGNLYGKILLSAASQPSPVVLLIAGSGPTDMDGNTTIQQLRSNSLKYLAECLSRRGISTLRFDKRGVGSSAAAGKMEKNLRFEDYVNDVKEWIHLLAADKRFSSVTVAGHSEGALIGMIACLENPQVKAFVSLCGAGRPADQLIEEQVAAQSEELLELVRPINQKLKLGKVVANIPQALYVLFRPSVQPYLISWYKFDPCKIIAGLKMPVLIVQGTTDIQVSLKDADALQSACPSARYALIEDMNHVLKICHSKDFHQQAAVYADPKAPVASDLVQQLVAFIDSVNRQ